MKPQLIDNWRRCYRSGWKGAIVDEAFSHPAKYSRALINRIYAHANEEGWLQPGDTVLDPFGGVALGAMPAMLYEINWIGMELEPRFCLLGNQNIERWADTYKVAGLPYGKQGHCRLRC